MVHYVHYVLGRDDNVADNVVNVILDGRYCSLSKLQLRPSGITPTTFFMIVCVCALCVDDA